MNCATCGWPFADGELACRPCIAKKARDAIVASQREHIPKVIFGKLQLRLARAFRSRLFHLSLFGHVDEAYCGQDLRELRKRKQEPYTAVLRESICPECLKSFDAIVATVEEVPL